MGLFSSILGVAAPIVGGIFGGPAGAAVGSALGGAIGGSGSKQTGSTTSTQQQQMDPRMQTYLYGDGTSANPGILGQASALANKGQNAGLSGFGQANDSFLADYGYGTLANNLTSAGKLQNSNIGAPTMQASQVRAPSQNGMDLSSSFNSFLNAGSSTNPYLSSALQSAVDQTNASYEANQTSATNNLQRNVLPGIRSGAIGAGGYGGTRQGIAEGNAIGDYGTALSNANLQLGLANSANTTGAQANSYEQGQNRALSALQGLSAQQYGVAGQNASLNQAASANNQQAQQSANALNSSNQATGTSLSQGLLNSAYGYANNNQNYATNQLGASAGILGQFAGQNGTTTSSNPYYENKAGNILGSATAGLGLYNQLNGSSGSLSSLPNLLPSSSYW